MPGQPILSEWPIHRRRPASVPAGVGVWAGADASGLGHGDQPL